MVNLGNGVNWYGVLYEIWYWDDFSFYEWDGYLSMLLAGYSFLGNRFLVHFIYYLHKQYSGTWYIDTGISSFFTLCLTASGHRCMMFLLSDD